MRALQTKGEKKACFKNSLYMVDLTVWRDKRQVLRDAQEEATAWLKELS
jgi:hypothetical protein